MLFKGALRDLLRPRRLLMAAPLVALPALLGLFWRSMARRGGTFEPEIAYNVLQGGFVFGFILVLLSVIVATGVVSQEMEQRTMVYLLTRPIARYRILLARFTGAWLGTCILVSAATLLLACSVFGPTEAFQAIVWTDIKVVVLGALAYGSLFLLCATLVNKPLIYGLFFAFGWESWVPLFPTNLKKVCIVSYLRVLAPHPQPSQGDEGVMELLSALNPVVITPTGARNALLIVTVVCLVAAAVTFSRRAYVPREDSE